MPTAIETPIPEDGPGITMNQLPWNQIPRFIPGTTNVQEYTQKLKFLAALWPTEQLDMLAPRAALLVEGTAFRKIARIPPEKLKVKSQDGIAKLVEAIGGSWGSTELEERCEYFEKALYSTIQRSDESHDSFLSRMESSFVELVSRDTKLEELQAYVLLRQSTLPAEDKKRILLEHQGELKYDPVVKSFRLLGSKFFNEFQTGKSSQKTRVYDAHVTQTPEETEPPPHVQETHTDRAYHVWEDEGDLDPEFLEILVSQEDTDAICVASFETELEEFFQETPELHDAMTTYIEARGRLLEKKKNRGFWPTKGGKGKPSKGRSKGFGKKGRDREQLLARIAKSRCRKCGALGHWKAECPMNVNASEKTSSSQGFSSASANVVVEHRPAEIFSAEIPDDEVFSEAEAEAEPESIVNCDQARLEECFMALGSISNQDKISLAQRIVDRRASLFQSKKCIRHVANHPVNLPSSCADRKKIVSRLSPSECQKVQVTPSLVESFACEQALHAAERHRTAAILDTGASVHHRRENSERPPSAHSE